MINQLLIDEGTVIWGKVGHLIIKECGHYTVISISDTKLYLLSAGIIFNHTESLSCFLEMKPLLSPSSTGWFQESFLS